MPQTDERPSPSPFRLGFRPPTSPDGLQSSPPLPAPATSPESLEDLSLDEPAPASDGWDPDDQSGSLDGTPSPGSTPDSDAEAVRVDLFDEEDLTAIARAGVQLGGEKAHELLANTPGKQAAGLMLTDEVDQAQIGDPLARIAARHAGDVGGQVSPDTKDFLAAMVGMAQYGLKQINRVSEARRLDAGAAALVGSPQPIPEDL